jgi:hypothetical protein
MHACRKDTIKSGKTFPLSETHCVLIGAGMVWIAASWEPDHNLPQAVSSGVISVVHPWGQGKGPWFMPAGSLKLTPMD